MSRSVLMHALACASLTLCLGTAARAAEPDTTNADSTNPVIEWNQTLLKIVRTKGAQPATIHPTRSFAILHAAIYDAVSSIEGEHRPYKIRVEGVSRHASQEAAADQAAHDVLTSLYPAFQPSLDTELEQALANIGDDSAKVAGADVGRAVAAALLALRADDGSGATPPTFVFTNTPGRYQSTPPNFPPQPVFTHWPKVRTFVLKSANEFRPGPPASLKSQEYADVFNEIKAVGVAGSKAATAEQALTGTFWNGPIQNYWNEIAQSAAQAKRLNTVQSARLFALLNLTLADSVIALYDAKYAYAFWRPVTAIRAADTDGNPATAADPNWLPEVTNSPADPAYPGAHAVISAAAAFVLEDFFKTKRFPLTVTSEVLPGVTRSFGSFAAAEQEASLSRVYAGVHFRSDENVGEVLGRLVADFVSDHALRLERFDGDRDHDHDHDRD
jgi:membrane-associated phospholipid phosphatase